MIKYIMPFIAIMLFISVFLSVKKDEIKLKNIPIDAAVIGLTKKQKITNPQFSGLTNFGDSFILKALEAIPDAPKPKKLKLINPNLEFDALRDIGFTIKSSNGSIDFIKQSALLKGNVFIDMTNGYKIFSERVKLNLKMGNLIASGKVLAYGPFGNISADSMEVLKGTNTRAIKKNGSLRFSNGVRLIYLPTTVN